MNTKKHSLPRLGKLILWLVLNDEENYQVSGDFEEMYRYQAKTNGLGKAKLWFWLHLLRSLPGFISDSVYWRGVMIKNYLKTAIRIIKKYKVYSLICISGLAIGMACCFVIIRYLSDELSYDTFHKDPQSIYRVVRMMPDIHGPSTRNPLAPALKENFSEVELAVRTLLIQDPYTFRVKEKSFRQEGILFADPDFFRVFTFNFVSGSSNAPLEDPFSVVLTRSAVQKYFGTENPVGKTISFEGKFDLKVTAVIENVPHNSHLQFEAAIPMEGLNTLAGYIYGYDSSQYRLTDDWRAGMLHTYLRLQESADPAGLERKFPDFLKKYAPYNKELLDEILYLQPVKDIHLFSQYRSGQDKISDIKFIYVILAIGFIILLMSCFNYINLSTAHFVTRMREISIRKVIGAQKKQLVLQFLMESAVFSVMAFILSFLLMIVFTPAIHALLGYRISLISLINVSLLPFVVLTAFFAAFLSGSYPAIFFSSFQPLDIMKYEKNPKSRWQGLRFAFVIFQFSITIFLMISTSSIYRQVRHMKSKDLGYSKEQIVVVPVKNDEMRKRHEAVKNELIQIPDISGVSFSSALPSNIQRSTTLDLEIDGDRKVFEMNFITVDYDFVDLFDMEMTRGRNYDRDFSADMIDSVVLNEKAAAILNWDNPVGKELRIFGQTRKVIGIVKDFNFQPLHLPIAPLAMRLSGGQYMYASIKISTSNIGQTLNSIEKTFHTFAPDRPSEYFFLDDYFENLYRTEENFGRTIGYFTLLAIIISSLGLFGLAFFLTERRTKEIGIRKVMGASVEGIALMLSKEFTKLALLANIIAWPTAYFAVNRWLQNFAYQTSLNVWIFLVAGAVALFIALMTVSYYSLKAAVADPVKTLRYE